VPNYSANRAKNDLASLNFDIQVDVSPVFNWNVKQLFLYLVAEYSTPSNVRRRPLLCLCTATNCSL
jgi:signal peptidase complex subunit 3